MLSLSLGCARGTTDPVGAADPGPILQPLDATIPDPGQNHDGSPSRVPPEDAGAPSPGAGDAAASDAADAPDADLAAFPYALSNLAAAATDLNAAPAATLDCGVTQIDTSAEISFDNWCGTPPPVSTQSQTDGPELAVIVLSNLTLTAQSTLVVSGTRPLVFVVRDGVEIAGAIDVSAQAAAPGPGGDQVCGTSAGGDGAGRERREGGGGGGGGFGTVGGRGGDDDGDDGPGGAAGSTRGTPDLVPLLAGCGGGRAGGCAGLPGAGGGALQISAGGALIVRGSIRAEGGAGAEACDEDAGGTGGGSGGAILLEAETLDVTGATLSASGGAGGSGQRGADGGAGASSAQAVGADGEEGRGNGAGGGGGGFGRIQLRGELSCTGC